MTWEVAIKGISPRNRPQDEGSRQRQGEIDVHQGNKWSNQSPSQPYWAGGNSSLQLRDTWESEDYMKYEAMTATVHNKVCPGLRVSWSSRFMVEERQVGHLFHWYEVVLATGFSRCLLGSDNVLVQKIGFYFNIHCRFSFITHYVLLIFEFVYGIGHIINSLQTYLWCGYFDQCCFFLVFMMVLCKQRINCMHCWKCNLLVSGLTPPIVMSVDYLHYSLPILWFFTQSIFPQNHSCLLEGTANNWLHKSTCK